MKKKCTYILDKEFEDCFDDGTLAATLMTVAANYGVIVNLTEQHLAAQRKRGEGVVSLLEKICFTQLMHILFLNQRGVEKMLKHFLSRYSKN